MSDQESERTKPSPGIFQQRISQFRLSFGLVDTTVFTAIFVTTIGTSIAAVVLPVLAYKSWLGFSGSLIFVSASLIGLIFGSTASRVMSRSLLVGTRGLVVYNLLLGCGQIGLYLVEAYRDPLILIASAFPMGMLAALQSICLFSAIGRLIPQPEMHRFYGRLAIFVQLGSIVAAVFTGFLGNGRILPVALLIDGATYFAAAMLFWTAISGLEDLKPKHTVEGEKRVENDKLIKITPLLVISVLPALIVNLFNASLGKIVDLNASGQPVFYAVFDGAFAFGGILFGILVALSLLGEFRLWKLLVMAALACLLTGTIVLWMKSALALTLSFLLVNFVTTGLNASTFASLQAVSSPNQKANLSSIQQSVTAILLLGFALARFVIGEVDPGILYACIGFLAAGLAWFARRIDR